MTKARTTKTSTRAASPVTASAGAPRFAQPVPSPDPSKFVVAHPSDSAAYKSLDALKGKLKPLPFGDSRGGPEPVLRLADILGPSGPAMERQIQGSGQLVFHAVGDTGSTNAPPTQNRVADKLVADFQETDTGDVPMFMFHLGDVVYSFGEARYYYDQFYEQYRNYPAPVIAIPGNHDGMVAPGTTTPSLQAFLASFCTTAFTSTQEAGGLARTTQIQPGVYYTFDAPFVRILALYSGSLESPGVISDPNVGTSQLKFLDAALQRYKNDGAGKALIIAHHHPAFTHNPAGSSFAMVQQIDAACAKAGVWPHAVLSAHAHNYQRYTRAAGGNETPYVTCGNSGHEPLQKLSTGAALRTPLAVTPPRTAKGIGTLTLESYDDRDYGYLRIVASSETLRIEYHPVDDGTGAKTPDDVVTVDLGKHALV